MTQSQENPTLPNDLPLAYQEFPGSLPQGEPPLPGMFYC